MKTCMFTIGVSIVAAAILLSAQITVDATGPLRQRVREATTGGSGSVARHLPLQLSITLLGGWHDDGKIEVEFTATNTDKEELTIPISPNPADLESADPKVSYSVERLSLFVTSDQEQAKILPGQTHLYGHRDFPGTLVTLSPGESIRVLTLVKVPRSAEAESTSAPLVAHVSLVDETVKAVDGQILSDTQEIGSASSQK